MPKWTNEQFKAITKSGSNIIVSAGAGSGKTEVLSERVIHKLKSGIKINELLILTFTNAAASEMKDRIRRKINNHPELAENLLYLDSAYITTFDSFTLSLVKKYNYLLDVSPDISIIDPGIVSILKEDIIDEVFNEMYESDDPLFGKLISDLEVKNDKQIKSAILEIIQSIEMKSDKEEFLDNYLANFLSKEKQAEYILEYEKLMQEEINNIETNIMFIGESDYPEFATALEEAYSPLINAKGYDEIMRSTFVGPLRRPRGSEDIKIYKESIDESIDNLKKHYLRFSNVAEIYEIFDIIKDYVTIIIKIIKKFMVKLNTYKYENDLFEFSDIAIMAINLLKKEDYIREELKGFYKEICVDEYQDTNDLQEDFIKLIENNNVYMVGDIKQSIYRFRNANPTIFKEKYDNYSRNEGGVKIDLLKNFRSRAEVLNGINEIFCYLMDNNLGGCDYKSTHQMNFGNTLYEEEKAEQNYDLEILNYDAEGEDATYEEIEAFIISKDILDKIENGYQVIDKKTKKLRNCEFKDFCIIMDRGSAFPTYKKIFEYKGIPLAIFEDKKLTSEIDIILLNNILGFILKIRENNKDKEFKYYFMSIARSYLFEYADDTIFEIIKNNTYEDTDIYKVSFEISQKLDILNNYELLKLILDKFNFYENTIKIGNVEDSIIRINNLLDIARNLSSLGYTPSLFKEYMTKMINSKEEIKYSASIESSNSVTIMNIHKSKGLEFPICYFSGYQKKFNTDDVKKRFAFDNKYGIITPFFKEGIGSSILKDLQKQKYLLDDISERIRLFYVALTRAKEKIIIVTNLDSEKGKTRGVVDFNIRCKYNSFLSILNSIATNLEKYTKNIDLVDYHITKDYLYNKVKKNEITNLSNQIIKYEEINVNNEEIELKHASKTVNNLISKEESDVLNIGTIAHRYFEQTDFLHILEDNPYYQQISNFVKMLNINEDTLIYKEHEFMFSDNDTIYHGIIDLVLIEDNLVRIVDYKLKNIDDPKYIEQLNVYKKYLQTTLNKQNIKMYLYSINDDILKEVSFF